MLISNFYTHVFNIVLSPLTVVSCHFLCALQYGGNPVSCAVGLAVLDVIEKDNLMENATKIGALMSTKLNALKSKYPLIGDVRYTITCSHIFYNLIFS